MDNVVNKQVIIQKGGCNANSGCQAINQIIMSCTSVANELLARQLSAADTQKNQLIIHTTSGEIAVVRLRFAF